MLYRGLSAQGMLTTLTAHGWSQSAIRAATGLSQPTVRAILLGHSQPTAKTFNKIMALVEQQAKVDTAFCRRLLSYLETVQ